MTFSNIFLVTLLRFEASNEENVVQGTFNHGLLCHGLFGQLVFSFESANLFTCQDWDVTIG